MALAGHQPIIKGHLGQKSSVLATTSCKLTKQMLVQQHLVAHYKKIQGVKTSIDTSCPKSWFTNAKARDSARKEKLKRPSSARPSSARRPYTADSAGRRVSVRDDANVPESARSYCDDPEVDAIVREVLTRHNYMAPSPRKGGSPPADQSRRPLSASQSVDSEGRKSYRMPDYAKYGAGNPPHGKQDPDFVSAGGDVIDIHSDKFTPAQPYTPRTLKRTAQSKLSQSKYYYRPKPKPTSGAEIIKDGNEGEHEITTAFEKGTSTAPKKETQDPSQAKHISSATASKPPAKSSPSHALKHAGNMETNISPNTKAATLFTRPNSGATNRQQNLKSQKESQNVPSLGIQDDPDKMRWLKQQAEKAQLRKEILVDEPMTYEDRSLMNPMTMDTTKLSDSVSKHVLSSTMQQYKKEEEELMYWNFISDVTNDVLARNIFTNTVLEQVFEDHIERNRHRLKISKMREMLQTIRADLGIPASDGLLEDSYGYKSTRPLELKAHDLAYDDSFSSSRRFSPERVDFVGKDRSKTANHINEPTFQVSSLTNQSPSHRSRIDSPDILFDSNTSKGSVRINQMKVKESPSVKSRTLVSPYTMGSELGYSSSDTYASTEGDENRGLMAMTLRPSQLKHIMNNETERRNSKSDIEEPPLIPRSGEIDPTRGKGVNLKPISSHSSMPANHLNSRVPPVNSDTEKEKQSASHESLVDQFGRSVRFAKDNEIISTRDSDDVSITDVTSLQTPKLMSTNSAHLLNGKGIGFSGRSNSSDTLDASSELGETYKRQMDEMDNKSNYTDDFEEGE